MQRKRLYALSLIIPALIWTAVFIMAGVFPFGGKTLASQDAYLQYVPFVKLGNSFFGKGYSMRCGLGFETLPLAAYYCMSPFNILYAIIPLDPYAACGLIAVLKSSLTCLACTFCFSKKHGKSDMWILTLSLAYTFCGFIANQFNSFIWTDTFLLFPLIFYFFSEYMEKNRKKSLFVYSILLFLAIWTNFYMAYGVCLFIIILFFFYFKHNGIRDMARRGCAVLVCSAIPLVLNGYMLVKTLKFLLAQPSNGSFGLYSFGFQDIFKSFLTGNSEAIPAPGYIYLFMTGFFTICLFTGLYSKTYRHTRKLRFFFALAFAIALVRPLNLLFHAGDEPNFFFNRYAYLFTFMFLYLLYDMASEITDKPFATGLAALCLFTATATAFKICGSESYTWVQMPVIYVTWLFIILYAVLFFARNYRKYIPYIIMAELLVGTSFIVMSKALPQAEGMCWEGSTSFHRVDSISGNGGAYAGTGERICFFSSTINQKLSRFLYNLSMQGGNTHISYNQYNYFLASILGQYGITDGDEVMDRDGYKKEDNSGILKYQYPLSVGFIVAEDLEGKELTSDTEQANNSLFTSMTGIREKLVEHPRIKESAGNGFYSVTFLENCSRVIVSTEDVLNGIRKNGKDTGIITENMASFCFTDIKKGDTLTFLMNRKIQTDILSFHADVFEKGWRVLKKGQFRTDTYSDEYISGEICAQEPSFVFFSIGWHENWNVYVDGKPQENIPACGVFCQVKVPAGKHRIEFRQE